MNKNKIILLISTLGILFLLISSIYGQSTRSLVNEGVDLYKNEKLPKPPHDTHLETFKGKPQWQRRKTYGFRHKKGEKIPTELPTQKWPIRQWKYMNMLRCLQAVDES